MGKNEKRLQKLRQNWDGPVLAAILLLAAFLTCYAIWDEGYGNEFYTAAVKSMTMSWKNFFFASLDPGGFITVDKPAPGLWLQCLFALVFGVHGWSVILPEALCSVASVWVLYRIVKRSFGKTAGLLAALFLALTPIFTAASRSNNLDAALVLVCLLSVWAILKAAEKGSLKYLLLSMALLGIGFNIKTLQAYLFLPDLYLVYFFAANTTWKKRIGHLILATVLLLAISLSWVITVDLIPASERPYVGSSTTNSELELAIGYNGLDRVLPSSVLNALGRSSSTKSSSDTLSTLVNNKNGIPDEGGQAGALRMFNQEMAGQASWMLVFAIFGMLALLFDIFTRPKEERKPLTRQLICWAGIFLPMYAIFSVSNHFHRYYLIMYAPCIAALSAIGFIEMWRFYTRGDSKGINRVLRWMLPAAIAATSAMQVYILSYYSDYSPIFLPILCIGSGIACIGLVICAVCKKERKNIAKLAVAAGFAALLAAPAYWSLTPIISGSNASIPVAGPTGTTSMMGGGILRQNMESRGWPQDGVIEDGKLEMQGGAALPPGDQTVPGSPENGFPDTSGYQPDGGENDDEGLQNHINEEIGDGKVGSFFGGGMSNSLSTSMIQYMMNNYDGERYLVAVPNAGDAEMLIIKYGVGVMAFGGFTGNDKAITLDNFITLVQNGDLRYYWIGGGDTNSDITQWVEKNGQQISDSVIDSRSGVDSSSSSESFGSTSGLYDLSGLKTVN